MQDLLTRAADFWFRPVEAIRLERFARVFSLSFLVYMAARFRHAAEWLTAEGFHLTNDTRSWFHPTLLPPMEPWAVPLFGAVLFGSVILHLLGWRPRRVVWVVLGCAVYVQLVDILSAFTLNKLYIVGYAVLAAAPAPRELEVDGRRGRYQSAWPLRTLQATLMIQFSTAGLCKALHGDWLTNPDVLWSQIQGVYRTGLAAWLLRELPKAAWTAQQHLSLLFEILFPVLIGFRRLRIVGFALGAGFLVMISLTMYELFYFTFQLATFFLLFLPPSLAPFDTRWRPLRPGG